jgi:protein-disulfide isomerase
MDYEKWAIKWNNKIDIDVTDKIIKHNEWNETAGITHTPTLFINGKKIPSRYNLKALKKLIPNLADEIAI